MEWWDDDPELLGATLGMLAAWQGGGPGPDRSRFAVRRQDKDCGDGTESTRSSSSDESGRGYARSSTSNRTATQARSDADHLEPSAFNPSITNSISSTTGRSINVSRERRKQELQVLRNQAAALQRQLCALRDRRAALLQPHYRDDGMHELVSMAPVWESMATRQFQARRKSEIRNDRLKRMLGAQMRVAEDLIRVIQRAQEQVPNSMQMTRSLGPSQAHMPREAQLVRLARMCQHWEEAFARCPKFAPNGPLRFTDLHVVDAASHAPVIELFSSQVLPFSKRRVEDVMWTMMMGNRSNGAESYDGKWDHDLKRTDDMLTIDFRSAFTIDGSARGSMTGKWLIKRFSSSDSNSRLVVSHSFSIPTGFQNEIDSTIIDDDSWARLVDAHSLGHTHLPQPLTVIQHVRRFWITFDASSSALPHPTRIATITSWFQKMIHDELEYIQLTVENSLMDETVGAVMKREVGPTNSIRAPHDHHG